jgi:hypothetical protein
MGSAHTAGSAIVTPIVEAPIDAAVPVAETPSKKITRTIQKHQRTAPGDQHARPATGSGSGSAIRFNRGD